MKKNRIIKYIIALSLAFTSLLLTQTTYAAGIGFSVEPIFSDNQIDKAKEFYYLLTKPGEEQIIEVDLMSTQEEPINIKITPLNAWTQSNGEIGYSDAPEKLDESLLEPLTSMFEIEENVVTLENYETKRVQLKLKAPGEHYEGVKAGALNFSIAPDEGEEEQAGVGTDYAVRVGVLTSESGDSYEDGKELLLQSAKATVINSHKLVVGRLRNPVSKILPGLSLEGTITNEKTGEIIKTKKMDNVRLAPNSFLDYEFDWGIDRMPAGDFIMTIKAENSVDSWDLSTKFSISSEEAKKVNEESAFKIITATWIKIVAVILAVLSVVISILIFVRMSKRQVAWKKLQLRRKKRKGKGRRR